MRRGKSIVGLRVISEADGSEMGSVRDLVFDHQAGAVLALVLSEKGLFGLVKTQVVPWDQVLSVGEDAVMVQSAASKIAAPDVPHIKAVMERQATFAGTHVLSADGQDLGVLSDLQLDEATGRVLGYEVSGGLVSDALSGKRFLPASPDMKLGAGNALVASEVSGQLAAQKQNEPGGLRGMVAAASGEISGALISTLDATRKKASDAYANVAGAPSVAAPGDAASVQEQPERALSQSASQSAALSPTAALLTPNDREVMAAIAEEAAPQGDGTEQAPSSELKPTTNPSVGLPHGPMRNEHSGGMTQTPTG